jgi:uncharacterized peroxidase-related enzyme
LLLLNGASRREFLRQVSKDDTLVQQIKADIEPRLKGMLEYAEQLTTHPTGTGSEHIEKLRQVGLSDRDILDLNQVVAYFNYVNRITE